MATLSRSLWRRSLALLGGATILGVAGGGYCYLNSGPAYPVSTRDTRRQPSPWTPPPRQAMLDALKRSGDRPEEEFDLLIVGGGATGAGVAVDATSRGLRVALVERSDFSSGQYTAPPVASTCWVDHVAQRYLVEIDQACPWWCSLPPESCHGARL